MTITSRLVYDDELGLPHDSLAAAHRANQVRKIRQIILDYCQDSRMADLASTAIANKWEAVVEIVTAPTEAVT